MPSLSFTRVLALTLLAAPAWAQKSPSPYRVLEPGTFFKENAPVAPGKGWLALSTVNGQWQLQATAVKSTPVVHTMSKGRTTELDALEISSSAPDALLLLKIPGLTSGKVQSVVWSKPDIESAAYYDGIDPKGTPIVLKLNGQNYALRADKMGRLRVSLGSQLSPLGGDKINSKRADGEMLQRADLVWAGDLNRDGGLDVIVRWSSLYSYTVCVFLSTGTATSWRLGKPHCLSSSI